MNNNSHLNSFTVCLNDRLCKHPQSTSEIQLVSFLLVLGQRHVRGTAGWRVLGPGPAPNSHDCLLHGRVEQMPVQAAAGGQRWPPGFYLSASSHASKETHVRSLGYRALGPQSCSCPFKEHL